MIWMIKVIVLIAGSWALAIVTAGFAVRWFSPMDVFSVKQFLAVFSVWNITDSTFPTAVLAIMWGAAAFMLISALLFLRFAHAIDLEGACGRALRGLWPVREQEREEPQLAPDASDNSEPAASDEATAVAAPQDDQTVGWVAPPTSKPIATRRRRRAEMDEVGHSAGEDEAGYQPVVSEAEAAASGGGQDEQDSAQDDGEDWRAPVPLTVLKQNKKAMIMMALRNPVRFIKSLVRSLRHDEEVVAETVMKVAHMAQLKPGRLKQAMARRRDGEDTEAPSQVESGEVADAEADEEIRALVERIKTLVGQYQMSREFRTPELLQAMVDVARSRDDAVEEALVDEVGADRATDMLKVLDAILKEHGGRAAQAQARKTEEVDETAVAEREALGGAGVGVGSEAGDRDAAADSVEDKDDHAEASRLGPARSARRPVASDDGYDQDLGPAPALAVDTARPVAAAAQVAASKPAAAPAIAPVAVPATPAATPVTTKDAVPEDVDPELADMLEVKNLQTEIANAGLTNELLNQLSHDVVVLNMDQRVADFLIYGDRRPGPMPMVTRWALAQLAEMVGEKQSSMAAAVAKPATKTVPNAPKAAEPKPVEPVPAETPSAAPTAETDDEGMDEQLDDLPVPAQLPVQLPQRGIQEIAPTVSLSPLTNASPAGARPARQAGEQGGDHGGGQGGDDQRGAKRAPLDDEADDGATGRAEARQSPPAATRTEGAGEPAAGVRAGRMEVEAMNNETPAKPASPELVGTARARAVAVAASPARPAATPVSAASVCGVGGAASSGAAGDAPALNQVMRDVQARRLGFVTSWLHKMGQHVERSESGDPTYNPDITGPILLNSRESKVRILRDVMGYAPEEYRQWRDEIDQLMPEHSTMLESLIAEAMALPSVKVVRAGAAGKAGEAQRPGPTPAAAERVDATAAGKSEAVADPKPVVVGEASVQAPVQAPEPALEPALVQVAAPVAGPKSPAEPLAAAAPAQPEPAAVPISAAAPQADEPAPAAATTPSAAPVIASGAVVAPVAPAAPVSQPAIVAQAPAATAPVVPASGVDMPTVLALMDVMRRTNLEAMQTLAREVREAGRAANGPSGGSQSSLPVAVAAAVAEALASAKLRAPAPASATAPGDVAPAEVRAADQVVAEATGMDASGGVLDRLVAANADAAEAKVLAPANEETPDGTAKPATVGELTGFQLDDALESKAARDARRAEIEHELEAVLIENRFKVRTKQYLFANRSAKFVVAIDVMASRVSGERKAVMFVIVDEPDTHWSRAEIEMRIAGNGSIVEPVAELFGVDSNGGPVKHTTSLMLRPLARERYCREFRVDPAAVDGRLAICVLVVCRDGDEVVLPGRVGGALKVTDFDIVSVTRGTIGKNVEGFVRSFEAGRNALPAASGEAAA